MTPPLIESRGLSAGYGHLAAVRDLDLYVDAGEVVALIGPNGAGKTSTLLALAGELAPMSGEIRWKGEVTTAPMHVRCRRGISYVTEERAVIMGLSTKDNLRVAGVSPERACELFPELGGAVLKRTAGLLSGGEQQMLSLARALGRDPLLLLADELSLGLAPLVVQRLLAAVRDAADERGIGILLVEQHVRQALSVADRVYVMDRGAVTLSGPVDDMMGKLAEIESAYLSSVD